MRDINLKATEYFEAVARLGTVTKAAAELGVSPSAVSQQIRILETQFGVRLFRRHRGRLVLSTDGDQLFQTTTRAFSAIRNARSTIVRQRNVRNLVLRTSPSFGVRWLGPRIYGFAADNREWNIRIDATPEFSAFDTEAIDLDLRYGHGDWPGLAVNPVMNDLVLPMVSPDYATHLREHWPDPIAQLAHANLIDSVKTLYRWDIWLATSGIDLPELSYQFRFDRSSMSIEMAKQGGGIALESATLCLPELVRGELVPFSPVHAVIDFPAYWMVCPSRHFNRRIVNRFGTWIREMAIEHENRVRSFLIDAGCDFRTVERLDLISGTDSTSRA